MACIEMFEKCVCQSSLLYLNYKNYTIVYYFLILWFID